MSIDTLPRGGQPTFETGRQSWNAWKRANAVALGFTDYHVSFEGTALDEVPTAGSTSDPAYVFKNDLLYLNAPRGQVDLKGLTKTGLLTFYPG